MSRIISPYYPPRARWYSPLLHLVDTLKRRAWLDRIQLPGVSFGDFVKSWFWPGIGFYVRGEKLIGKTIMLGAALLTAVFIVWLGHPVANVAFGLLISAHVTSILFLTNPWFAGARFGFRLAFSVALLVMVGGGIYAPIRDQFQTHLLLPLRMGERVVVVERFASARSVKTGDWIAYALPIHGTPGVYLQAGLGLGPVLAKPGDHIRFTPDSFEVNGVARKPLPHMPQQGEMVVAEKNWFVWPDLAITGHGNTAETVISAAMLQLASVPEESFLGKPFRRWFWRRQILT